jgi:radical SAM-linked protein
MRLFSRGLRRSGLPLFITNGFNPHPKISFERALKLGQISEREVAYFFLKTRIDNDTVKDCLNRQLPDGITLKEVGETYD